HHYGISSVMPLPKRASPTEGPIARTIRFPRKLRLRIAVDSERCGRSFEAQVLAILRRHYGEDVDIAPAPAQILELARGSLSGVSPQDHRALVRRLVEDDGA